MFPPGRKWRGRYDFHLMVLWCGPIRVIVSSYLPTCQFGFWLLMWRHQYAHNLLSAGISHSFVLSSCCHVLGRLPATVSHVGRLIFPQFCVLLTQAVHICWFSVFGPGVGLFVIVVCSLCIYLDYFFLIFRFVSSNGYQMHASKILTWRWEYRRRKLLL